MNRACPCSSGEDYDQCCAPLLSGAASAQTPEQLMRSRFCAFVKKNTDYLVSTHSANSRPPQLALSLKSSIDTCEWLALRVMDAPKPSQTTGSVEFVAVFRDNHGQVGQIHERSNFECIESNWFYTDGTHLPPFKFSRNEACPCGSGKKFKKCCETLDKLKAL